MRSRGSRVRCSGAPWRSSRHSPPVAICWKCSPHNEAALRLYRKQGFETAASFLVTASPGGPRSGARRRQRSAVGRRGPAWSDQAADYTGCVGICTLLAKLARFGPRGRQSADLLPAVAAGQALGYGILDPRSGDVTPAGCPPRPSRRARPAPLAAMGRAAQSETLSVLQRRRSLPVRITPSWAPWVRKLCGTVRNGSALLGYPLSGERDNPSMSTVYQPWPELPLDEWQDTFTTLHLWSQIVGKIRLSQAPWTNHPGTCPLYLTSRGLTTSP
jgi:hypothetical protein